MEKETVHRTYSSWTWNTCKPNICFLPFYSSMASQFFSPSIFTVVVQSANLIYIILWSFPMFLVVFTSQAADNQFLPDVLRIKAAIWAETAADSWDKHCLEFFAYIFYFIRVNNSIQNHSLTAHDKKNGLIRQTISESQSIYFIILKHITNTCWEQAAVSFLSFTVHACAVWDSHSLHY